MSFEEPQSTLVEGGSDGIKHKEIEHLKLPIQELLTQLKEPIDRGEYKILIGDDVSGRIPTLIFSKILNNIYKGNGFPIPKTLFMAGFKIDSSEELKEKAKEAQGHLARNYRQGVDFAGFKVIKNKLLRYFNKKTGSQIGSKRVLLITDSIASGMALEYLTTALKEMGISFDIATIGLLGDKEGLENKLGGRIFYSLNNTPEIYRHNDLSGVAKKGHNIFSSPQQGESRTLINEARSDIDKIAEDLSVWYKNNK